MISRPVGKHMRYFISKLRRKGPSFLFYYLTTRCNSKCHYCHVSNISTAHDADLAEVLQNLYCARGMGITHVILTGGEPLLYRELKPILEKARDLGFHVTLTTNGLAYPEQAMGISGLIDNLEFSLPTADPEIYAMERGIDGYHMVLDAMRLAISLGEKPVVSATVTDGTVSTIPSLIDLTERLGVILLLKPTFDYFGNRSLNAAAARRLGSFRKTRNVWYNEAFMDFFISGGNGTNSPRCRTLASTIAISPGNGLYLPCFHHMQEELPIEGNLQRLMKSYKVQAYRRRRGTWTFCEGCRVICYFEDAFLWPPGKLLIEDIMSRVRWIDRWQRFH